MGEEIRISVRDLVEFVLRSGDLDERAAGASEEAMLEGARMHRKLQREEGPEYMAEVPLSILYPILLSEEGEAEMASVLLEGREEAEMASVLLEGRADGIFEGCDPENPILGDAWTVDEIKTTYRKLSKMKEPEPVHLAQAKCYAYIYLVQNHLEIIRVRMTYCSLVTQEIRRFTQEFTASEITGWFEELMKEYSRWAGLEVRWKKIRDKSLSELEFPFAYRPGQKELAVHVYHTICHGRKLFMEAPTGTGKTISTVFPALKAMGEGKADRLFYFTAKTVTARVALDTFSILREQGLRLRSIHLTAKEKVCPMEKRACNPDACPRAKGHFDRVNEALYALLTEQDEVSREILDEYAANFLPTRSSVTTITSLTLMLGSSGFLRREKRRAATCSSSTRRTILSRGAGRCSALRSPGRRSARSEAQSGRSTRRCGGNWASSSQPSGLLWSSSRRKK